MFAFHFREVEEQPGRCRHPHLPPCAAYVWLRPSTSFFLASVYICSTSFLRPDEKFGLSCSAYAGLLRSWLQFSQERHGAAYGICYRYDTPPHRTKNKKKRAAREAPSLLKCVSSLSGNLQNDLVHGWGFDLALRKCVEVRLCLHYLQFQHHLLHIHNIYTTISIWTACPWKNRSRRCSVDRASIISFVGQPGKWKNDGSRCNAPSQVVFLRMPAFPCALFSLSWYHLLCGDCFSGRITEWSGSMARGKLVLNPPELAIRDYLCFKLSRCTLWGCGSMLLLHDTSDSDAKSSSVG